jgi:hypothetical protein
MITVPMVAALPGVIPVGVKSPVEGTVVGFVGLVILLLILNRFFPILRLKIEGQTVTRISILQSALWNMFSLH